MNPLTALAYSFFFGLLHGILPDEHTWPITFSYAIGGASGREGLKAGFFFSAAFTVQRMLIAELTYLALAPFLLTPALGAVVDIVVGIVMSLAGFWVLSRNRTFHFHLLGRRHDEGLRMAESVHRLANGGVEPADPPAAPPIRWTIVHGFIAGFGFGGFSLFVNLVAAPAMRSPWLGFLPGLAYGLGTMATLAIIGFVVGASMRWTHLLSDREVRQTGSKTGGRTLLFGGILFAVFGIAALAGLDRILSLDAGYALIGLFMVVVAVPAFLYSLREVLAARQRP